MKEMQIIEFSKNKVERFAQSNKLIEARYSLNLEEQRLVLTMISMIKPTDDDFKCYRIKIKEFANFFKIKGDSIVAHVKKTAKSLVGKPITIKDENRTLYLSWISSAEFPENEENGEKNYVELSFDPKLKPYLLKMKEQYTLLENIDLIKLKSGYSVRIYMLLKQYLKIGKRSFKISALRDMLGIEEKQYPRSYDFRVNVLNKAESDINNKTELMVTMFEEEKTGKKLISVFFTIRQKTEEEKAGMLKKNEVFGGGDKKEVIVKNEEIGASPERTSENIKKYFTDKGYKSSSERFEANKKKTRWKGIYDWQAAADEWELTHQEMFPDKHKKTTKTEAYVEQAESSEITTLRSTIKRIVSNEGSPHDSLFFLKAPIEKTDVGYKITVLNPQALKYEEALKNIVKIEVK